MADAAPESGGVLPLSTTDVICIAAIVYFIFALPKLLNRPARPKTS